MNYKVRCPPNCPCGAHKDFRGGAYDTNESIKKIDAAADEYKKIAQNLSSKDCMKLINHFISNGNPEDAKKLVFKPPPKNPVLANLADKKKTPARRKRRPKDLYPDLMQLNENKGGGFLDQFKEMKEKMPPINLREFTEGAQRGGILGKYVNQHKGGGVLDQLKEMKEKYPNLAIDFRGLPGAVPAVLKPEDPYYRKDFGQVIYPENKGGGLLDDYRNMKIDPSVLTTPGGVVGKPFAFNPGDGKQFAEAFKWMKKK